MDMAFFILINSFSRIVPHLPNMTTVGSVALFTGATLSLKKSFAVTFLTMIMTDMVLGFHSVMWATYGGFLITILLGRLLKGRNNWKFIGTITLLSSLQFFILTNFAVWLTGFMYPKTLSGLFECYIMALPFFRNSLLGDLFYTTTFFGAFEIVKRLRKFHRYEVIVS